MRMRSTVRPSSCVLPSSCARPALIASRRSATGSRWKDEPRGSRVSAFGGTNLSVSPVSRVPPSSDGVPLEQASARASAFPGSGGKSFRRTRYLCGGVWSIQISFGPRVDRARGIRRGRRQLPLLVQDRPGRWRECCLRSLEEAGRVAPGSGDEECRDSGDWQRRRSQKEAVRPDALATANDRHAQQHARVGARRRPEAPASDR